MCDFETYGDCHDVHLRCAKCPNRTALHSTSPGAENWRDDPSADERWNAGLDFGMRQFCAALDVDPEKVTWDAATETLDGDVNAAICNILRVKFGDDFDGTAPGNGAEKVMEALAEIETIILGGWSNSYDQDFGTKDDDYKFDCILEQVRKAKAALHSTSAAGETAEAVLNGIRDALEIRGYFHMANGKDIGALLDRAAGETTSSDGGALSSLPSGENEPVVTQAYPSSEAADVLAMKEACKRAVSECLNQYGRMTFVAEKGWSGLEGQILAAIDKLSPEVKAEGGRDEPVACVFCRHLISDDDKAVVDCNGEIACAACGESEFRAQEQER